MGNIRIGTDWDCKSQSVPKMSYLNEPAAERIRGDLSGVMTSPKRSIVK